MHNRSSLMKENDQVYKFIFRFLELVKPFIKQFAPTDVARDLDYSSLRIVDTVQLD